MPEVSNKQLILLLVQTLKLHDEVLMNHGFRVAYLLYQMLKADKDRNYESYEIADYCILALFHDIGAYRTEEIADMMKFETKCYMPHSLYGYFMMKNISPYKKEAKILLYHHMTCKKLMELSEFEEPYRSIAANLFLADRVDIYFLSMGKDFDLNTLRSYEGERYTKNALDLLEEASREQKLLEKLDDNSYLEELAKLWDSIILSNEDEEKFIGLILYSMGIKNQHLAIHTVKTMAACSVLSEKMFFAEKQREILKYAALIHDTGILKVPPGDMDSVEEVLQAADFIAEVSSKRACRLGKRREEAEEIEELLLEGKRSGRFQEEAVSAAVLNMNALIDKMSQCEEDMNAIFQKTEANYLKLKKKYI